MSNSPKEAINLIANGRDFYFCFKTIDVIRNGQLVKKLSENNCVDSSTTFRKGGPTGGIVTSLDFSEEGMRDLQQLGVFRGMEPGFDLFLIQPWRWMVNAGPIQAIANDVNAGGIEKFVIVGGDDKEEIFVQIYTSDGYIVQLGDPMNYFIP